MTEPDKALGAGAKDHYDTPEEQAAADLLNPDKVAELAAAPTTPPPASPDTATPATPPPASATANSGTTSANATPATTTGA